MGAINLCQMTFDRTSAVVGEDLAVITSCWRETLAFQPDNVPMDHAARLAVQAKLDTFFTTVRSYITNAHHLVEYRFYDIPDAAPHKPVFIEAIPTALVSTARFGSSTQVMPFQVACSITFRTDKRRQWGRFYVPGIGANAMDTTNYQYSTGMVDGMANAAKALTDRSNTSLGHPTLTVWSRVQGTHHDPQYVECDSVPDVIRSRRASITQYKRIYAAG